MSNQLSGQILLVEDDQVNQMMIKGLLNILCCKVSVASNGAEALALLTITDAIYDVVLMDIVLPDFNGLEVTTQPRQSNVQLTHSYYWSNRTYRQNSNIDLKYNKIYFPLLAF